MISGKYTEKSIQFVQNLWHAYIMFPATKNEIEEIIPCISPGLVVIGTGKHEFYQNREKFLQSLDSDLTESGNIAFDIYDEWYQAKQMNDNFYLVYGSIWFKEKFSSDKTILVDMYTRFSVLLEYCEDDFVIHHIHQSIPYLYQQEGEYYPKTFVDKAEEAIRRVKLLEKQVEIDSMTGLYNRIYTELHINEMLNTNVDAVFFVTDLDDFKQVNDTLGHLQGDEVIQHYAKLLQNIFPADAIIGRVGGDEFTVFAPDISAARAEQLAQTLIQQHHEYLLQYGLNLSCSVGMVQPLKHSQFTDIYHNADKALYFAKQQGKHSFSWFVQKDISAN